MSFLRKCFLTKHSVLYNITKNAVKNSVSLDTLRMIGIVNDPPEERAVAQNAGTPSFAYLARFKDFADASHIPFVVVLVPPRESLSEVASDPYGTVKEMMRAEGIDFLDLREDIAKMEGEGESLYWPKDLHWNSEGNRRAGILVSEYLMSGGIVSATTER